LQEDPAIKRRGFAGGPDRALERARRRLWVALLRRQPGQLLRVGDQHATSARR
jgi:hypothetical protein